jgi:hypothetical protein
MSRWANGDPERAMERLRETVDEACRVFTVQTLNFYTLLLAGRLDEMLGQPNRRAGRFIREMDAEDAEAAKAFEAMMGESPPA